MNTTPRENTRNIPVIGKHPAMTVGLIQRLAKRHEREQGKPCADKRYKYLSRITLETINRKLSSI